MECPLELKGFFKLQTTLLGRQFRDKTRLDLPIVKTKTGQLILKYTGAKDRNSLPNNIREITSINHCKQTLFK